MKLNLNKLRLGGEIQPNVKTVKGAEVILMGVSKVPMEYPVSGFYRYPLHEWREAAWDFDGVNPVPDLNLVMARPKVKLSGTMFVRRDGLLSHDSLERADMFAVIDLGKLNIEVEEGEGLPWS